MKDSRIHIVQMIHGLPYGGAERCVVDIVNQADPQKFKFTILLFRDVRPMQKEIKRSDVKIVVVEKKGKLDWSFQSRLVSVLRELHPAGVHTHLFTADWWGRRAARALHLPVVTTEHNMNLGDGWLRNFLKKITRDYSQQYVACSKAVKKYMQEVYGIRKDIKVVRYGVETARFASASDLVAQPPFKLLMIGRLSQQKGQAVALSALRQLLDWPWELKIVGEGELESKLKEMVQNYGLVERVKFLAPSDQVPEILADSHFFLMPSLWEGLGIVVMEAMCAGRLVIGSRVGGIPELIHDGKTGLLVEPRNEAALVEKLRWCFSHQAECVQLARAGREYAQENFTMEKMINAYEKIYEENFTSHSTV